VVNAARARRGVDSVLVTTVLTAVRALFVTATSVDQEPFAVE
jgi:hypothetical protein